MANSAFSLSQAINPVQYMALSNVIIANTTTETSALSSTAYGSKTILANRLVTSSTVNIQGGGIFSIPLVTPGNVTIRLKINGATVITSVVSSLTGAMTDGAFQFDCSLVCRTAGSSGILSSVGGLNFAAPAGARIFSDLVNGGTDVSINTTIDNTLDITAQWQTASTTRSITVRGAIITITN